MNYFPDPSSSIGIIIPVLDDAAALAECLAALAKLDPPAAYVSIADGGSRDDSAAVARASGYTFVQARGGRHAQLAAAVAVLPNSIDTFVFLHADTQLPTDALAAVAAARAEGELFGCFRRKFSIDIPWIGLTDRLAAWRASTLGISYGDQTQWIARELLDQLGGIPQLKMEDLYLGLRAHEVAGTRVLNTETTTSARRLDKNPLGQLWADNFLAMSVKYLGRANR